MYSFGLMLLFDIWTLNDQKIIKCYFWEKLPFLSIYSHEIAHLTNFLLKRPPFIKKISIGSFFFSFFSNYTACTQKLVKKCWLFNIFVKLCLYLHFLQFWSYITFWYLYFKWPKNKNKRYFWVKMTFLEQIQPWNCAFS